MKAVILAAGEGKRLRKILGSKPKALLEIRSIPLIERVILSLTRKNILDIIVIIRKDAIELKNFLEKKSRDFSIKITIVQENTESGLFSFLTLEPFLNNGYFLLFTVDIIYKEQDFSLFIDFCRDNSNIDMIMAVTKFVLDEKPVFAQISNKNRIIGFGRKYVKDSDMVSAGMYYCSSQIYREKKEALSKNIKHLSDFFGWVVNKGYRVIGFTVSKVVDVDDEKDAKEAAKFLDFLDTNK